MTSVRLGTFDLESSAGIELEIKNFIKHPRYKSRMAYYDLAIITLETPVNFTSDIYPICLPDEPFDGLDYFAGDLVILTGWGLERRNGLHISYTLRYLYLKQYDDKSIILV